MSVYSDKMNGRWPKSDTTVISERIPISIYVANASAAPCAEDEQRSGGGEPGTHVYASERRGEAGGTGPTVRRAARPPLRCLGTGGVLTRPVTLCLALCLGAFAADHGSLVIVSAQAAFAVPMPRCWPGVT